MGTILDFLKEKENIRKKMDQPKAPLAKLLERCAACGDITDVPFDTPISERKCFVPGAGQLCRKCCVELYGTDDLRSL